MIIYKITNSINNKIYIGQTVNSLNKRWNGHRCVSKYNKKTHPIYNAMRKHGIENFTIEEIGGANSQSELNYKEFMMINKHNTLAPNGYNLKKGGNQGGKYTKELKKEMSIKIKKWHSKNENPRNRQVINIKTKQVWVNAKTAAQHINMKPSTLRFKLNGKNGNETNLRYVGTEDVCKEYKGSGAHNRNDNGNEVININTGQKWKSGAECARDNNINCGTLKNKLNGVNKNDTYFKYTKDL